MKSLSIKNANARLCLVVGATVGISQGLVQISSSFLGPTVGYLVNMAIVAALAFAFCSCVDFMLNSREFTDAK